MKKRIIQELSMFQNFITTIMSLIKSINKHKKLNLNYNVFVKNIVSL